MQVSINHNNSTNANDAANGNIANRCQTNIGGQFPAAHQKTHRMVVGIPPGQQQFQLPQVCIKFNSWKHPNQYGIFKQSCSFQWYFSFSFQNSNELFRCKYHGRVKFSNVLCKVHFHHNHKHLNRHTINSHCRRLQVVMISFHGHHQNVHKIHI